MSNCSPYCCPEPQCNRPTLVQDDEGLRCPNGHLFSFVPGTSVPVFTSKPENVNEYSQVNAAEIHDNALRWVFSTFRTDEATLRSRLIARLGVKKGDRVLVTGAGTGNDLPYLVQALSGEGYIFAQDFAKEMLVAGISRYQAAAPSAGIKLQFSVSDAMNLPFSDNYFDSAYHFGGINLYRDPATGIFEMNRVVRPGGAVVIGDEGLAPWLIGTEFGRMLIKNNPLYASVPPMPFLPETARSVELTWELSNTFYVVRFSVSDCQLPIDIDVPHVGKRGGTIRSRYFGQLEGVDPTIREKIYLQAEKRGLSRVEHIESVLRGSLVEGHKVLLK